MENKYNININDVISTTDKHGLHGHVSVFRRNKSTEEVSLWDDSDNIIPISGYQFVLMKMFGLHLDSSHKLPLEKLDMDTTLVTPDLNNNGEYKIGIDPNDYSIMADDISSRHIVQGFMIGNGGGAEDNITTKTPIILSSNLEMRYHFNKHKQCYRQAWLINILVFSDKMEHQ